MVVTEARRLPAGLLPRGRGAHSSPRPREEATVDVAELLSQRTAPRFCSSPASVKTRLRTAALCGRSCASLPEPGRDACDPGPHLPQEPLSLVFLVSAGDYAATARCPGGLPSLGCPQRGGSGQGAPVASTVCVWGVWAPPLLPAGQASAPALEPTPLFSVGSLPKQSSP